MLFASPEPLTQSHLNSIFELDLVNPESTNLEDIVDDLQKKYIDNDNAFSIVKVACGYQLVSRSEYEVFIRRLLKEKWSVSTYKSIFRNISDCSISATGKSVMKLNQSEE